MTPEDVVNNALLLVKSPIRIGSFYDGTPQAIAALDIWSETRDAMLSTLRPEWARKEAVLSEIRVAPAEGYSEATQWTTSYPAIPWTYEYSIPDECLVPLQVKPRPTGSVMIWRPRPSVFRVQRDVADNYTLLTNISPAILTYIARVLSPDDWHEEFTELVVQALAQKFGAKSSEAENANQA